MELLCVAVLAQLVPSDALEKRLMIGIAFIASLAKWARVRVKCRSAVVGSAAFVPKWHRTFSQDYDPKLAEMPSVPSSPFP
jgi:hypothetical protein